MMDGVDPRAGLPANDLHQRVREAAFALLLTGSRPVAPSDIATVVGVTVTALAPMLEKLVRSGWIDRDRQGRVAGSAGLSLTNGPHALTVNGTRFRTWCAYDAVGIPAALGADGLVETDCPVCGLQIELPIVDGRPPARRPERMWLAQGGADLRADFCSPTVLLCSSEHATIWSEAHGGHGQALDIIEGATLGGQAWAACAGAVAALGGRTP